MWVAFANAKTSHIFSTKNISVYAIFNDQSFNDTLTNDIVSFEQLGPVIYSWLKPLLGTKDMSYFRDRRVHVYNSDVKVLMMGFVEFVLFIFQHNISRSVSSLVI